MSQSRGTTTSTNYHEDGQEQEQEKIGQMRQGFDSNYLVSQDVGWSQINLSMVTTRHLLATTPVTAAATDTAAIAQSLEPYWILIASRNRAKMNR